MAKEIIGVAILLIAVLNIFWAFRIYKLMRFQWLENRDYTEPQSGQAPFDAQQAELRTCFDHGGNCGVLACIDRKAVVKSYLLATNLLMLVLSCLVGALSYYLRIFPDGVNVKSFQLVFLLPIYFVLYLSVGAGFETFGMLRSPTRLDESGAPGSTGS